MGRLSTINGCESTEIMQLMNQCDSLLIRLMYILRFSFHRINFGLGSGSDFLGFDQLVGSSNYDATYTFNPADHGNLGSYPLYHTSYEVFPMVKRFVDPTFAVNFHDEKANLLEISILEIS
jgi:hypothetical protein